MSTSVTVMGDLSATPFRWSKSVPKIDGATFVLTGELDRDRRMKIPMESETLAHKGRFSVTNDTTGPHTVTVLTEAPGSVGVEAPQGETTTLESDGINVDIARTADEVPTIDEAEAAA